MRFALHIVGAYPHTIYSAEGTVCAAQLCLWDGTHKIDSPIIKFRAATYQVFRNLQKVHSYLYLVSPELFTTNEHA